MPRISRRRGGLPRALVAVALGMTVVVALAACARGATPSPDPSAPCGGVDVERASGFYPDLEAHLPATVDGASPSVRDSGRYCSPKTLGPLVGFGHAEVRFAGETFPATSQAGLSLVVYSAPDLTGDQVAEAFRAGAAAGRRVQVTADGPTTIGGRTGRRVELINGDARQVVVVWPAIEAGLVRIVIGSDVSNAQIDRAVAALDAAP